MSHDGAHVQTSPGGPAAGPLRVGMLAISPVHFQVPLYRSLAQDPRIAFRAIFCSDVGVRPAELGYGQPTAWDDDLLSGFEHHFLAKAHQSDPAYGRSASLTDPDVVRHVRSERYDVLWLHGYSYVTQMLGLAAQRSLGLPVMFREDQTLIHARSAAKSVVKEVFLRALFRDGPALYVGSESRRWFEHYGVPRERTFHVPHAIDNDGFADEVAAERPRREELREAWGLPADQPVILMVSRLAPNKQPGHTIEAFRRLRERIPCSLLVVGAGELEEEMRRTVAEHAIPDVAFAGFVNRDGIPGAFAAADIFVLYSALHETWGLVVNEAMAASLPVVVSDACGSAADLVHEGRSGHVVDRDRIDLFADRLHDLVADPVRRAAMGREGRRIVAGETFEVAAEGVVRGAMAAAGRPTG